MLYVYVGLIVVTEAAAFSVLKEYSISRNPALFVGGAALYALICFFLVKTFSYEEIGVVNVLWSVFSILSIIGVGALFFHEALSWKEVAGVAFAILGVALLSWG